MLPIESRSDILNSILHNLKTALKKNLSRFPSPHQCFQLSVPVRLVSSSSKQDFTQATEGLKVSARFISFFCLVELSSH